MDVRTLREILAYLDAHYVPDKRWQDRQTGHFLTQDKPVVRLWASAFTKDDPPKFYMACQDISITKIMLAEGCEMEFIQPYFRNLIALLDSFLDARCACVPGPNGELGAHCDFHKEVFGSSDEMEAQNVRNIT